MTKARKKVVMSMYSQPRPSVIQPTTEASALVKLSVKSTPHRTNAAEIATVTQNTMPKRWGASLPSFRP